MAVPEKYARLVRPLGTTLAEAMQALNDSGAGVVFLVDGEDRMKGVLTDGDIRRAMLAGAGLATAAERHMSSAFVAGRAEASRNDNLALMNERIRHLPILDTEGRLVDCISWKDLWHIPLVSPSLAGNELKYVEDCIVTGWVSSQGTYIRRLEEAIRDYVGTADALTTANGTLALQLALQALDVGHGDEVIVPDFTFGASANAVIQRGARPVFVDVDPQTWTLDPAKVEAAIGPRTKALMPVHIYGHPCDMDPLMEIAGRHGLRVVEDCAEALGAEYKGRKVGAIGDVGCFSFFANKIITTGEGGACTANDPVLARRLRLLRDHGMRPERRYWHEEPGTNCRMTNLQAAVGLAQMERIGQFLSWRDSLAARYDSLLDGVPGIRPHRAKNWARKVTWLYTVEVDERAFGCDRDTLMARLKESHIECRPTFPALHPQPAFAGGGGAGPFAVAETLARRGLSLPTGNDTPVVEVMRVTEEIRALAGVFAA